MQALEEQIKAAKVGDEVELRCGGRFSITDTNKSDPQMPLNIDPLGWYHPNGHPASLPISGKPQFDIVRVIPKLEDGWVRWAGGQCPVAPDTIVDVRFECGEIRHQEADDSRWEYDGSYLDGYKIIAYRVVEQAKPSLEERLDKLLEKHRKASGLFTTEDLALVELVGIVKELAAERERA